LAGPSTLRTAIMAILLATTVALPPQLTTPDAASALFSPSDQLLHDPKSFHKIVDGNKDQDWQGRCRATNAFGRPYLIDYGQPESFCADPSSESLAGAVCCADGQESSTGKTELTAHCESDCERVTYEEAHSRCAALGLRMCFETEVFAEWNELFQCNYRFMFVWVADACASVDTPNCSPTGTMPYAHSPGGLSCETSPPSPPPPQSIDEPAESPYPYAKTYE